MVRASCCEKMGLKKGPWSSEEDQILVSFIQKHGHENWRALPKRAGLLRCGKSCRLRWTNYLRPDIKRGNFSTEEEQTIIQLHQKLGNRWSAIAAKLPGRTDNEIKNVWHTNIKKKIKDYQPNNSKRQKICEISKSDPKDSENSNSDQSTNVASPQCCNSEMSSVTDSSSYERIIIKNEEVDYNSKYLAKTDESFWSENFLSESMMDEEIQFDFPLMDTIGKDVRKVDEDMDFWYNLFITAGGVPEI